MEEDLLIDNWFDGDTYYCVIQTPDKVVHLRWIENSGDNNA